ncbi:phage major capsid protein [Hyphomicrobium sp.]|uniref:phage major capsid protein n=1 Tax=Hyphomicrobium sp. TaxID=82 RepID=UPI002B51317E|nr:phage major capsid protein [Hyphomicrobium sp.]HRQ25653.1 phage major capsid protein [Hyphomicrobium sp.]
MSRKNGRPITVTAEVLSEVNAMRAGVQPTAQRDHPIVGEIRESLDTLHAEVESLKSETRAEVKALEIELREMNTKQQTAGVLGGGSYSLDERADRETFAKFGRTGIRAASSTDSNPDGGYTVPRTIDTQIARLARDATPMRGLASVVTIEGNSYVKTVSLHGPTATWVGEREARDQTPGLKLSQLEFFVHELQAMPAATQTLLDDAFTDVAALLSSEIATAFSEEEDLNFVRGDGVKRPHGFLSYPIVANSSWTWGKLGFVKSGVAAALTDETHNGLDALQDLYYALRAPYRTNGSWLMNSATANVISKLKDENGNYLWQPSVQAGSPNLLYGRPVTIDENMDPIGADKYPVAFGDFARGYLIVDRIGIRLLRDPYSSKPYVLFYTTKRVGGGVQNFDAIKLLKIAA